jgi:fructose-1,6-bisphosphatase/inositol monophosphatase family enzyme
MKEKELALTLAKQAGKIIKDNFSLGMKKEWKEDNTPLTITDTEINKLVIKLVKQNFKNHSIIGEEESDYREEHEYCWVCDPVDGTIPFSHGVPTCVFSLALVHKGKPILGVVYDPFMDRMFFAEKGKGATLNGKKIKVSSESDIKKKVIGICTWSQSKYPLFRTRKELDKRYVHVMNVSSITYMGALVANGEFIATIFSGDKPHDTAALKIIVEEAGGKVTDLFGNEQRYDREIKGHIISNSLVHQELVNLTRSELDKEQN